MTPSQSGSFRVSFTDAQGQKCRVRVPAFYALALTRSNMGRRTSSSEVLLYEGYALLIDKRNNEFALLARAQKPVVLCAELRRMGLHWEANHLQGKIASASWHKMSLAPISSGTETDRHLLVRGALR